VTPEPSIVPQPSSPAAASHLPGRVASRLWEYPLAELEEQEVAELLTPVLLEEGSGAELRWLIGQRGAPALAGWLARDGGRLLSARSRAFWELVLGVASSPPHRLAHELWPLA
jgi:hypothetical protein